MGISDFTIGQMRSKVVFYSNNPVKNDTGGLSDNWSILLTTRGRLRRDSGRKINEQGEIIFSKDYELICRYQNALTIDPKGKILIDGAGYRIKDFRLMDEIRHLYIFILAKNEK